MKLFENLEDGAIIAEFREWFPGISKLQLQAVLAAGPSSGMSGIDVSSWLYKEMAVKGS